MSISLTKRLFLSSYTLYMIVAAWVVGLTLGMGFPEWYFEWYPFIPIFFYVFGWFYIYMFDACHLFAPQRQQYVYLAMKGIKMIFSMGIILFYAVHVKEQKTEFFLTFFLFYVLSMIFESAFFMKFEGNKKKQLKAKKEKNE